MIITTHAKKRMTQRGISQTTIELAISIGRYFYSKEALFFFIGKKEVKKYSKVVPLITKDEGVVVISSLEGTILTTYRNRNFLKKFKTN